MRPVVHAWARHGTTPMTPSHLPRPFVAIAPFRGDMGGSMRQVEDRGITLLERGGGAGLFGSPAEPGVAPQPYPNHRVIPAEAGIHPDASPRPLTLWPAIRMDPGLRRGDTVFLA